MGKRKKEVEKERERWIKNKERERWREIERNGEKERERWKERG